MIRLSLLILFPLTCCALFSDHIYKAIERGDTTEAMKALEGNASLARARKDFSDAKEVTPLMYAARYNRKDVAELLIAKGADVNAASDPYWTKGSWTALHYAAYFNAPDVIRLLMRKGADYKAATYHGETPLHLAAQMSAVEAIKALLDEGVPLDIRDKKGNTPLIFASRTEDIKGALFLLERGADPNAHNIGSDPIRTRWTALMWASFYSRIPLIQALAAKKADLNAQSGEGMTALMVACDADIHSEVRLPVVRELIKLGADLNIRDSEGRTAMMANIKNLYIPNYRTDILRLLLDKGAKVNIQDNGGRSALVVAVQQSVDGKWIGNKISVIKLLLEKGEDVNLKTKGGKTALMELLAMPDMGAALGKGKTPMEGLVQMLLDHGADVNVQEPGEGRTALFDAVYWNRPGVAELLIKKGARIDVQDKSGYTPLMLAVRGRSMDCVKLLIRYKADVTIVNKYGRSVLMETAEYDNPEMLDMVLAAGLDVDTPEKINGWTPLMIACISGSEGAARRLIERGARVNARDSGGRTPLMLAASPNLWYTNLIRMFNMARGAEKPASQEGIVRMLLQKGADAGAKDRGGLTALDYARKAGRKDLAQLLEKKASP